MNISLTKEENVLIKKIAKKEERPYSRQIVYMTNFYVENNKIRGRMRWNRMKYIFNRCAKIFQGDDVTIHYTTDDNGLEIVAFCSSCLEKYLEKTKGDITAAYWFCYTDKLTMNAGIVRIISPWIMVEYPLQVGTHVLWWWLTRLFSPFFLPLSLYLQPYPGYLISLKSFTNLSKSFGLRKQIVLTMLSVFSSNNSITFLFIVLNRVI